MSNVTAFSVSKDNNLITDLIANGTSRRDIPATKALVGFSISLLFEDTTMRNRFMNQLVSRISAQYTRGSRSFLIELNRLVYESSDRAMEGQTSYISETLTGTAFVDDPTAENSVKLTVDTT